MNVVPCYKDSKIGYSLETLGWGEVSCVAILGRMLSGKKMKSKCKRSLRQDRIWCVDEQREDEGWGGVGEESQAG